MHTITLLYTWGLKDTIKVSFERLNVSIKNNRSRSCVKKLIVKSPDGVVLYETLENKPFFQQPAIPESCIADQTPPKTFYGC